MPYQHIAWQPLLPLLQKRTVISVSVRLKEKCGLAVDQLCDLLEGSKRLLSISQVQLHVEVLESLLRCVNKQTNKQTNK